MVTVRAAHLATATAVLLTLVAAPALGDPTGASTSVDATTGLGAVSADRPTPVLPREMRGRAAVEALGERLAAVAARNDLSAKGLTKILTQDRDVWLAEDGQMLYRDEMLVEDVAAPTPESEPPTPPEEEPAVDIGPGATEAATGSGTSSPTTPAYPTSQTFTLHSRPAANKQIFLDFNGAEVTGTGWNTGSTPLGSTAYSGYDSDGNVNSFSTAEHAWMQEVWRQVAEAYAPLDVDVTTVDEGESARTRSTSADTTYGTQVLFTNSSEAVAQACDSLCLGVAYVGTFDNVDPTGYYQPAWVFTKTTMSTIIAAQGASHEAGHTLGLHHDGTSSASYYAGTSAWGPIMGSAKHRAVSHFSLGEYAGANNRENDFTVMANNGLPLRTDDHGSTVGTADQLGAQTSYVVNGVLGTRQDLDLFAIDVQCPTDLTVSATGIGPQTTADLKLDVLNGSGAPVAGSSPTSGWAGSPPASNGMNASVTVPVTSGTYFLQVDGVGNGDPAGFGWSDYGSLGQYRLTSNGCTGTTQPADPPAAERPGPPVIGVASSGASGGAVTAVARWSPPTSDGGAAITKYRVIAKRLNSAGQVVASYGSAYQSPAARKLSMTLPKARYKFVVYAWNKVGASAASKASNIVNAR
jgi:hypothetical protein